MSDLVYYWPKRSLDYRKEDVSDDDPSSATVHSLIKAKILQMQDYPLLVLVSYCFNQSDCRVLAMHILIG